MRTGFSKFHNYGLSICQASQLWTINLSSFTIMDRKFVKPHNYGPSLCQESKSCTPYSPPVILNRMLLNYANNLILYCTKANFLQKMFDTAIWYGTAYICWFWKCTLLYAVTKKILQFTRLSGLPLMTVGLLRLFSLGPRIRWIYCKNSVYINASYPSYYRAIHIGLRPIV